MIEYLLAPHNTPFFYAFCFVVLIMILEVASLLMGAGLSQIIDNLFDATDVGMGDVGELDIEIQDNFITKYVAWIKVKNVPLLILVVVYFATFSTIGYIGQNFSTRLFGNPIETWIAALVALILAFPFYKTISNFLGQKLFKEETTAISERTFVGKVIEINTGTAKAGLPAEGKYRDQYGQLHYFMVEPENEVDEFEQGSMVELTKYENSIFKAIKSN